jgi:hypothetical protein
MKLHIIFEINVVNFVSCAHLEVLAFKKGLKIGSRTSWNMDIWEQTKKLTFEIIFMVVTQKYISMH